MPSEKDSHNLYTDQVSLPLQEPAVPRSVRHLPEVITAVWSPPATKIACSKTDSSLRIWKLNNFAEATNTLPIMATKTHEKPIESISWNPDGDTFLATVGNDKWVKIWNTITGQVVNQIDCEEDKVFIVQYSGDSKYIAAISKKNNVVIIDTFKNEIVQKLPFTKDIFSITWSNTSSFLFIGLNDGTIPVLYMNDDSQLEPIHTLCGHRSAIKTMKFDYRGKYLAVGSNEGVISLWSLADFTVAKTIGSIDQPIYAIDMTRDSIDFAVTFEDGESARIYDIETLEEKFNVTKCVPGSSTFPILQFCPIKTSYLYTTDDGEIIVTTKQKQIRKPRRD